MIFAIIFQCVGKREIFPKPASFLMKICDNFHFSQKGLKVVWWRAGTQRYGTKFESTFQLTMKGCVKTLLDVSLKKILRNSMLQMHGHSTQEEFWSQYFKFFFIKINQFVLDMDHRITYNFRIWYTIVKAKYVSFRETI